MRCSLSRQRAEQQRRPCDAQTYPDEKDGRIVKDPVEGAALCSDLACEATRVASQVWRSRGPTDRGEAAGGWVLLSHLELGRAHEFFGKVRRNFDGTVGTQTAGMDDAFGDALADKVGQRVEEIRRLEQQGTTEACCLVGKRVRGCGAVFECKGELVGLCLGRLHLVGYDGEKVNRLLRSTACEAGEALHAVASHAGCVSHG